MEEEPIPAATVLTTILSIGIGLITWTYGFVFAVVAGLGALILPYLRPPVMWDALVGLATMLLVLLGFLQSAVGLVVWSVIVPVYDFVFFILSPAIYPLVWIFSWGGTIVAFVSEFKALYTFFGTAVLTGIITGTIIWRISFLITTLLGWQDEQEDAEELAEIPRSEQSEHSDGEVTPRKAIAYTPPSSGSQASTHTSQLQWYDSELVLKREKDEGEDLKNVLERLDYA